jgi:hypothetical protein
MRERAQRRRLVTEISFDGAIAGYTVCAILVLSGAAFVVGGWDELWRTCDHCMHPAASAALATVFSAALIVAGVGLGWSLVRRPVDPDGSSRAVVALGVAFAVGMLLLAWRIPAFTCARGRLDTVLDLCMRPRHQPTTSEPASWTWVRLASAAIGLAGGALIGARPRWARVTAPMALLACGAGIGLFLSQTFVG